ncbi:MAG: glycosyltransferase family 4 protein [Candidatus Paceibacterales bacterium]
MRLLIITQKADIRDSNLGFFHRWLEKFAQKLDKAYVVCLSEGEHLLPHKVKVYSLGKEKGFSKARQFLILQRILLKHLKEIKGVFVHMCPIYAMVSTPLIKLFRKKIILWYAHSSVNPTLKIAEKCVDKILTASPESCRLENRAKIEVIGHGIDIELFKPKNKANEANKKFKILSPGRISPIKDQKTLVKAMDILVNKMDIKDIKLQFAGSPIEDYEKEYSGQLKDLVQEKKLGNYIEFLGGILYKDMPQYYQNSDLVLNLSLTGSIDKVVLEAMASGNLVLTCNDSFVNILDNKYLFKKKDPQDLAEKIINLRRAKRDESLREIVIRNHSLDDLIDKVISRFL